MINSSLRTALVVLAALGALARAAERPRVPEGYTIEIAAAAPLVRHPMMATFDEKGRLFVAESAGTNRKAQELIDNPLDFIRMLEDTDGDGVFDTSTVFADRLTFPQGVLCHDGAVFTCAPPYVWRLQDTDGDGVCDERTVLVESFGFNGNAASIHGPFLGPDGRLYWCDGRHGHEFFDEAGALISKGKAARIFSCRPDGSDVRTFCGGGMDNPVEVDWLDSGEMIGTVNLFYGRPRGDVLVHWVEGGVYPRLDQQDCIDEFTWTGGVLPEIHNYGHVAVSGMCRERFSQGGAHLSSSDTAVTTAGNPTTQGAAAPRSPVASFLVTQFNTHKVVRTTLAREGSTFTAINHEDLVVWDDPDVHPTDVLEAPDGSILIINTGGWFRIGCPVSQIAKPEIAGAIYRLRRPGATFERSPSTAATAVPSTPDEARLWLSVGNESQHLAAAQVVAQAFARPGDEASRPAGEPFATAVLTALRMDEVDAHLRHALTLALIRIGAVESTRTALSDPSPQVQRAALIALEQMPDGQLRETEVIGLLETDDRALLQAVLEVISRHDGWVAETVPMFREWLTTRTANPQRLKVMREFFLAQQEDLWVQELVADALAQPKTIPPIRRMVIDVIAAADLETLPPLWGDGLNVPLAIRSDPDSRQAAIRTIGARGLEQHDAWLQEIAGNPDEPVAARSEAFAAVAPRLTEVPAALFAFALGQLTSDGDLIEKLTLARGLASAQLDEPRLLRLAQAMEAIGPSVAPILLPAFEQSDLESVGAALVAGLATLGDTLSLSPQELNGLLEHYPEAIRTQATPLVARLEAGQGAQVARLDELLSSAGGGEALRGRSVFFGKTAGCSVCHRVGNEGGLVGPALSNIGAIRQPRDLLEAIAFPSASFAREYRPYLILTEDGHVHSGIILSTTNESVTLRTADLREVRIPRSSIDVMEQSDTSIMPRGLDTKLSQTELNDLLAYLISLKARDD